MQSPAEWACDNLDIAVMLTRAGWLRVKDDETNEYWRRPGKSDGHSATLRDGVLYVFTSSAPPFAPDRGYSAFGVYAAIEADGDLSRAASQIASMPQYAAVNGGGNGVAPRQTVVASRDVDLSAIVGGEAVVPRLPDGDPGAMSWSSFADAVPPQMREPVVTGLLRRGEIMNIVAAPKTGKSWLSMQLAACVATGKVWLTQHECARGRVLLWDNELHDETIRCRMFSCFRSLGIDPESIGDSLLVSRRRGRESNIDALRAAIDKCQLSLDMIVIDAMYRMLPRGMSENDNADMTSLYNQIDAIAAETGAAIVLVHHTSKGTQSEKGVTDVGSGAGAQSRAADTHMVLRRHAEEGRVVMDAVVRSWYPAPDRVVLALDNGKWTIDPLADPDNLWTPPKRARSATKPADKLDVSAYLKSTPRPLGEVVADLIADGASRRGATEAIAAACEAGTARRVVGQGRGNPVSIVAV